MIFRDVIEEEVKDILDRDHTDGWAFERRNRNRTVDWWLMMSIRTAMRSLNLHRYRNPAIRRAILEAREAVAKAENLIRRDYWERKDQYREHSIAPVRGD